MRRQFALPLVVAVAALLAGCQTSALSGGGGGGSPGLLQSAFGGGTPDPGPTNMTSGLIANNIGTQLSPADQQAGLAAEYRALEVGAAGVAVAWQGPTAGVTGEVVPGPIYAVNDYQCRDYTQTIRNGVITETARGTACRQPGQPWSAVG